MMTIHDSFMLLAKTSLALLVVATGLATTRGDLTYLFRHPRLLLRSTTAMHVLMPAATLLLLLLIHLPPMVVVVLVALSISPMPPLLTEKTTKAGGAEDYTVSLLAHESLLAIIMVPVSVAILAHWFAVPFDMAPQSLLGPMFWDLLLPLLAAMAFRLVAPAIATKLAPVAHIAGVVALLAAVLPALVKIVPPAFGQWAGDGTLAAMAAMAAVGLIIGHALGGDATHRPVLALATASRHPGVAVMIASMVFPGDRAVGGIVVLYLLVSAVVTMPYVFFSKRRARESVGHQAPRLHSE